MDGSAVQSVPEPFVPGPGDVFSRDIADYPGGIVLVVDKPYRWTSADVIRKLKYAAIRHFSKKNLKVGHAGTLDPLATGILLVCIGPATRRAEEFQSHDKEYVAGVAFGATTPSYDLEKEIDRLFSYDGVTEEAVRQALPSFLGEQEQVAPLFSAKSVDGVRAYELARKMYRAALRGEPAADFDAAALETLRTARIRISEIELLGFTPAAGPHPSGIAAPAAAAEGGAVGADPAGGSLSSGGASSRIHVTDNSALGLPRAEIRIACSKGTYIRAFARDLGEALGTGAHLDALRRTRSGAFRIENALSLSAALSLL
jgi:tRNA pseudouridine55 synthase